MSWPCLRCNCEGIQQSIDSLSFVIIKSITCSCVSCVSPNDCVFSSIRHCFQCNSLYSLSVSPSLGNNPIFSCPNNCIPSFKGSRFSNLTLTHSNVNNTIPPWNRTILHTAIQAYDVELTWNLLKIGANPFLQDFRGITPIDLAQHLAKQSSSWASVGKGNQQLSSKIQKIAQILPNNFSTKGLIIEMPPQVRRGVSDTAGAGFMGNEISLLPPPPDAVRSTTCPVSPSKNSSSIPFGGAPARLLQGIQKFTPLTLIRLTSDNEVDLRTTVTFDEPVALGDPSIEEKTPETSSEILDWKLAELRRAVVEETEIQDRVPFNEGTYQCTACFDEVSGSSLGYLCGTLGCHGAYCLDCFVHASYVIISAAMYAVPVLRCPGCLCRIPTKVWRGVLKTQKATPPILGMVGSLDIDSTAESILYGKYCDNAEALMKMRCGSCHTTNELFISEFNGDILPRTVETRSNAIDSIVGELSTLNQITFFRSWLLFNTGRITTDTFVTTLYDLFESSLTEDEIRSVNYSGLYQPLETLMVPILQLFCDVERRLCAQLGLFRKYPKIMTRCCYEPHCFMCKVYGHHEDATCEQIQEQEIGIDAQFCPACGVPTLRTEGCSHIVCLCGEDWEWQEY